MFRQRQWKDFPKRIADNLNGYAGSGSLGGLILGVIGFMGYNAFTSDWVRWFGIVGVSIMGISVLVALYRSIPPLFKNPKDLLGRRISLEELSQVYPKLMKLSVVGPTQAGKTTLVNMVRVLPAPNERTLGVHAYITVFNKNPDKYIAIIDGSGQTIADQFNVASQADILCIVLDHNISSNDQSVDDARLNSHEDFMRHLQGYFRNNSSKKIPWIHLLLNKRDLWVSASDSDKQRLHSFFDSLVDSWRTGNWAFRVTHIQHSNQLSVDVTALVESLTAFIDSEQ